MNDNYNIKKEFETLNLIHQFPRLYLTTFFSDLLMRINVAYIKKDRVCQNSIVKYELNENWLKINQKVNIYQSECIKNVCQIKFDSETSKTIQLIAPLLDSSDYAINLIQTLTTKLKSIIFLNKTIIFFETNPDDTESCLFGKLIFITNEHLNAYLYNDSKLTTEMIKSNEVIKKSLKVKSIIETVIDLKKINSIEFPANKIISIETNLFSQLSNLISINLASNQINYLETNTFFGLEHLEHVDLSSNYLTEIEPYLFKRLINLKE
jgi:hypothetical protein